MTTLKTKVQDYTQDLEKTINKFEAEMKALAEKYPELETAKYLANLSGEYLYSEAYENIKSGYGNDATEEERNTFLEVM